MEQVKVEVRQISFIGLQSAEATQRRLEIQARIEIPMRFSKR